MVIAVDPSQASLTLAPGRAQGCVDRKHGDWEKALVSAEGRAETRYPVNPKKEGEAKSNSEIALSIGRRRFSNLSALLHCFVTTEQMSVIIKLVVIRTTPACLIKLKLREHLHKIEL